MRKCIFSLIVATALFGTTVKASPVSVKVAVGEEVKQELILSTLQEINDLHQGEAAKEVSIVSGIPGLSQIMINEHYIYAVNVKAIYEKEALICMIRELYEAGKMIYIYGGISGECFLDILGIESLDTYLLSEEEDIIPIQLDRHLAYEANKQANIKEEVKYEIIGCNKTGMIQFIEILKQDPITSEQMLAHIIAQEMGLLQSQEKVKAGQVTPLNKIYSIYDSHVNRVLNITNLSWTIELPQSVFEKQTLIPKIWRLEASALR